MLDELKQELNQYFGNFEEFIEKHFAGICKRCKQLRQTKINPTNPAKPDNDIIDNIKEFVEMFFKDLVGNYKTHVTTPINNYAKGGKTTLTLLPDVISKLTDISEKIENFARDAEQNVKSIKFTKDTDGLYTPDKVLELINRISDLTGLWEKIFEPICKQKLKIGLIPTKYTLLNTCEELKNLEEILKSTELELRMGCGAYTALLVPYKEQRKENEK